MSPAVKSLCHNNKNGYGYAGSAHSCTIWPPSTNNGVVSMFRKFRLRCAPRRPRTCACVLFRRLALGRPRIDGQRYTQTHKRIIKRSWAVVLRTTRIMIWFWTATDRRWNRKAVSRESSVDCDKRRPSNYYYYYYYCVNGDISISALIIPRSNLTLRCRLYSACLTSFSSQPCSSILLTPLVPVRSARQFLHKSLSA